MFKKKEMADAELTGMDEVKEAGEETSQKSEGDREKLIAQWSRDAEQLKIIVPEFDLSEAIANDVFKRALLEGKTVFEAYSEMKKPQSEAKPREEIPQNGKSARRGTGGSVMNPAKMSSKAFNKYIENIRENG